MLFYLAGDEDCVRIVHAGEKPIKESIRKRDYERYRDLSTAPTLAIGKTFARFIERWEIEHRSDPGVESGRTVRPHMRRAHSHLYWTGEGRKQPRVRFLLPISVRGAKLVEEPPPRSRPARLPSAQSEPAPDRLAIYPEFARNPLDPFATLFPRDDLPHQIPP